MPMKTEDVIASRVQAAYKKLKKSGKASDAFALTLIEMRQALGISQEDAAKSGRVTQRRISEWESAKVGHKVSDLPLMAKVYRTTQGALLSKFYNNFIRHTSNVAIE